MIANPKLYHKVTVSTLRTCSMPDLDPLWLVLGPLIRRMTISLSWLVPPTTSTKILSTTYFQIS